MNTADDYRQILKSLVDWEPYLLQESGLPGPRGNLELAQIVAYEGSHAFFDHLLTYTAEIAPANTAQEYLAFCGVVGLGRLLAEGDHTLFPQLRTYASDPRWRTREAVAMALQRLGKVNMAALLPEMEIWADGNWLEKRAVAAALAEPALLRVEQDAVNALRTLDAITSSMQNTADVKNKDFKVLEKGLSYCWSVVVAAAPAQGKPLMEKWLAGSDLRIRRIMQENLKKNRLMRMDAAWVKRWRK